MSRAGGSGRADRVTLRCALNSIVAGDPPRASIRRSLPSAE
jgi:hypothetical protein